MEIQKVTDAAFRAYGKVLEGYDFSELQIGRASCRERV